MLTPLTWVSPRIRDLVHQRASSMIMDPKYIRPLPTKTVLRTIRLQEVGCFLFIWAMVARLTMNYGLVFDEPLSPMFLVQVYLTERVHPGDQRAADAGRPSLDQPRRREMNFIEQMLDSVNYPHNPLIGGLWAPVGLRFHALHHIFPTMPYHALAEAHRRLMRDLPADSPYRLTEATVADCFDRRRCGGGRRRARRRRRRTRRHTRRALDSRLIGHRMKAD